MADTKITALAAITTVDPAADVLPIVDVSDTSMAASGTTKKITSNQILGAGGTATLASATITGDLTVDTSTLKVDSANNRVGIGTATPASLFTVYRNTSGEVARFLASTDSLGELTLTSSDNVGSGRTWTWNGVSAFANHVWQINSSTAMTLNSTGLGVGNTPVAALDVYKVANDTINRTNATFCFGQIAGLGAALLGQQSASAPYQFNLQAANAANSVQFPLVLQPSGGNVGVGVTPSASTVRTVQSQYGVFVGSDELNVTSNAYFGSSWKYVSAATAARYSQAAGVHYWFTAAAGAAANDPITTFAAANAKMTLDASGNLILQSSATPATLTVNGQLTVNATSNTNLRFSYRGSDGTTRTANITLA